MKKPDDFFVKIMIAGAGLIVFYFLCKFMYDRLMIENVTNALLDVLR